MIQTVGQKTGAHSIPVVPASDWVGALPSIAISVAIAPTGGSKTVTTSGTSVALVASSTDAQMLYVRAKADNTNNIYFGNSTVDETTSQQITLIANQAVTISATGGYKIDVNQFYIDADTNGEGVDFLYIA